MTYCSKPFHKMNKLFMTAGRTLVEYEFQQEDVNIGTSVEGMSEAVVKIVFRRRVFYHVTNTCLQTFILAMVAFMTMFFAIDNTTDRVMVTLTTMLVVATVITTIQAVLLTSAFSCERSFCVFISNNCCFPTDIAQNGLLQVD